MTSPASDTLSTKAVVAIAASATVANAALYEYVPVVHTAVDWLTTPRYIGVTTRLSGEVRNAVDAALIQGATVKLLAGSNADPAEAPRLSTTTDEKGAFVFEAVPVGEYTLVTTYSEFADGIVTNVTLEADGNLTPIVAQCSPPKFARTRRCIRGKCAERLFHGSQRRRYAVDRVQDDGRSDHADQYRLVRVSARSMPIAARRYDPFV